MYEVYRHSAAQVTRHRAQLPGGALSQSATAPYVCATSHAATSTYFTMKLQSAEGACGSPHSDFVEPTAPAVIHASLGSYILIESIRGAQSQFGWWGPSACVLPTLLLPSLSPPGRLCCVTQNSVAG